MNYRHQVLSFAIQKLQAAGYRLVSVADCLGMPPYLWTGTPQHRHVSHFLLLKKIAPLMWILLTDFYFYLVELGVLNKVIFVPWSSITILVLPVCSPLFIQSINSSPTTHPSFCQCEIFGFKRKLKLMSVDIVKRLSSLVWGPGRTLPESVNESI